ncbi:HlyD family efflux transporter periplasmic adaptor subunit [uncultured Sunxiuqinia sp.]|uniref:efflux RND transporter periplasmic adaptor subunit n=1 Tax=uncultured Sunxiuqinia sp. TaxID=1573825 RepID=UPI0030DD5A5D|tara:strand:- start:18915 stop:20093 length:1179 start_codon:yes stop_codon:yes gene_type:complete
MNWRKITFVVVALIVLLGGSALLSKLFISMKPEAGTRPEVDVKRYVAAQPVAYSDITSEVTAQGRVISGNEVVLIAEAAGKIEAGQVSLKKGASFKKGQHLATIYKDEVELELKSKKSIFLNSLTNILPDLRIDFPDSYEVFLKFFNEIDLNEELPELPEYENEKLKIFLASQGILNDYYSIRQNEKRLERHSMYAPFDGTFTEVNYEVGAYVNTNGQIAKMIRTDLLELEVPVENEFSKWIKLGDRVKVIKSGQSELYGTVVRKAAFVDQNSQSRSVFVKVDSKAGAEMLTGEYLSVEFPGYPIKNAMEIPRSAVFNTNTVFTVADGYLQKRQINIIKVNTSTLIFDGLEEGTYLVTEALINVKERTPVEILGAQASGNTQNEKQQDEKGS